MTVRQWIQAGMISGAAIAALVQPAWAQEVSITAIDLEQAADGVRLQLETSGVPEIVPSTEGNAYIVEIRGAQLRLAEGSTFEQANPNTAIASVQVTAVDDSTVRIVIQGAAELPAGEVVYVPGGVNVLATSPAAFTSVASGLSTGAPVPTADAGSEGDMAEGDMAEGDMAEGDASSESAQPLTVIVTATRTETEADRVPRSVTVISREQVQQQTRLSRDVGEALGKLVPGFGPPTQSSSGFGQSLRGRSVSVLIDGVPQSVSRNVFRDLNTIDPDAIERIEVLRGPTAIYGDGATGGVINIITRRASEDRLEVTTEVGVDTAAGGDAFLEGDSIGYSFGQSISGTDGGFDYVLSATFAGIGSFYDAQGDRVPPDPNAQGGLADADRINLLSKLGVELAENQRLQFTFEHFEDNQNTDFTSDLSIDQIPGRQKARARRGLVLEDPAGSENTVLNLDYTHRDFLNGRLHGQAYYRNFKGRFFPFDARSFASLGNTIFQSELQSEKWGTRLDLDTPLTQDRSVRLLWGLDYNNEDVSQPLDIFDPVTLENSGGLVFRKIGDRSWTPPYTQKALGLFAQLNWDISDRFLINGGVRHERVGVDVDTFTTIRGDNIGGGDLDYNATLFNVGTVVGITDEVNAFANFAQGFSLADVGLALRNAPAGFSVETLRPEPQKVDHYEIGLRGDWDKVQGSIAAFYNQSDLGTSFTAPGEVLRDPQRIYGVELTLDAQPSDRWQVGGNLSLSEGDRDSDDDGDYESDLNGFSISPLKISAYVEHATTPGWSNRLQALFSGSRDPEGDGFGLGEVESYFTVDYLSSIELGRGTLTLGVENLFNNQYFPVVSQLQSADSSYSAARGRTIRASYSFSW
ncbi:TonB-dependent receptor domain-containing protein [Geitlerinema sp. PCC 7407]|uniref:TonB-dependent receptor domain-containing protein n=1 Tax=Geitlerinema sp. PCC 7407 TaxID=1173025 RepID=UPI00029FEE8A|nr:TonB-dependent receptor [Geitlerinema sp. PCC 7407]AFY66506.1 TonB-dependent receptor [Geitlerinema sp. PCC 7407]